MDWIPLAQDKFQWRALVNAVMNVEFKVLTAVSTRNSVFWYINTASRSSWY
jgi:hypothetical protein